MQVLSSVAKSLVFPQNWSTFTMLPQVVFLATTPPLNFYPSEYDWTTFGCDCMGFQ